jgi:hypothetical protein
MSLTFPIVRPGNVIDDSIRDCINPVPIGDL